MIIFFSASFLQYIAYEINPDDDEEQHSSPSKEQLDEEKQLLLSFKPVMQKFLHDHIDLQVSAMYALQVHCNTKGFPKGTYTHLLGVKVLVWVREGVGAEVDICSSGFRHVASLLCKLLWHGNNRRRRLPFLERRCQPRVSREGESIISGNIMSTAWDHFWFCTVFPLSDRMAALHIYVINSSLVMISFEYSRQVHVNHISFVWDKLMC